MKYKINLMYDSKLKDNDTRQKIRIKKQSRARIDPIDLQIMAFHFTISNMKFGIQ